MHSKGGFVLFKGSYLVWLFSNAIYKKSSVILSVIAHHMWEGRVQKYHKHIVWSLLWTPVSYNGWWWPPVIHGSDWSVCGSVHVAGCWALNCPWSCVWVCVHLKPLKSRQACRAASATSIWMGVNGWMGLWSGLWSATWKPSLDCLLNADGVELSKTNVKSEKKLDFDPCFHSNRYSDWWQSSIFLEQTLPLLLLLVQDEAAVTGLLPLDGDIIYLPLSSAHTFSWLPLSSHKLWIS